MIQGSTAVAADVWEIERRTGGAPSMPFGMVLVRYRSDGRTIVKASSSDIVSVFEYADQLVRDLTSLSVDQFARKYSLTVDQ